MQSPQKNLTVSLVQTGLIWQKSEENRDRLAGRLNEIDQTDLIILPEMFNSGFTMDAEKVAEQMDGPTVQWMLEQAARHQAAVTGSLVIQESGQNYNRMIFARPDGGLEHYDKRHLFRMADEHHRYGSGSERKIVEWHGWRIGLFVCYDLRFPVWCRNRNDIDLMLFVASWPAARAYPWKMLLKARAIENLCYVAGVNRIGTDMNNIDYSGDSALIDMKGQPVIELMDQDIISSQSLSADDLDKFRTKFPAWMDSDEFSLTFE